ncbi:hypothetical protein HDU67_009267 [Dinochytrium kinnereticum]|nr:hypothetical protein HDU67_009267 [Dinochytrium kinnereticum]
MNINEFMKKRAEIEADYSRNLSRMVKPYKDELAKRMGDKKAGPYNKALMSSTMMQAWTQLLNQTESEAAVRNAVSEKIDTELRKSVKTKAKEYEKKSKEKFDELKKAMAELQKQVSSMEKLREKFESEKKSMEASRLALEKAQKNSKSTEKEQESHMQKEIQKEDENTRIAVSKIGLMTYYELLAAQQPGIVGCLNAMSTVFQQINGEYDSDLLIKMMKTGTALPPDYVFDEKVVRLGMALKAINPDYCIGGKRFHCQKTDVRQVKIRSKGFFHQLMFNGNRCVKDDDDAILAMPGKKGRKLAADRVKALDKDLAEAERKRQGVETLISVYDQQATKDPKYAQDLQSQKASFDIKIDNIGLKRHRLMVYIAEVDKAPAPELPNHLVGKSIQASPTSPEREFLSSPSRLSMSGESSSPQFFSHGGSVSSQRSPGDSMSPGDNPQWGGDRPSISGPPVICKARMVYDFEAAPGSQEVSAFQGEDIDIIEQQDDG